MEKKVYHSNKANIAVESHFQFTVLMDCIKMERKIHFSVLNLNEHKTIEFFLSRLCDGEKTAVCGYEKLSCKIDDMQRPLPSTHATAEVSR
jgi:hypothetical protein